MAPGVGDPLGTYQVFGVNRQLAPAGVGLSSFGPNPTANPAGAEEGGSRRARTATLLGTTHVRQEARTRAQREEKVLQYIIHRVNEDADLHDVLQEPYVRRICSQDEIDELVMDPELVHHCRSTWSTYLPLGS